MELVARIRAVLRRAEHRPETTVYEFGSLYICPERHEVRANGEPVALTYKGYMLQLLTENYGRVLTREVLPDRVRNLGSDPLRRFVLPASLYADGRGKIYAALEQEAVYAEQVLDCLSSSTEPGIMVYWWNRKASRGKEPGCG